MDFLDSLFPKAFAAQEKYKMISALIFYIVFFVIGTVGGCGVGFLLGILAAHLAANFLFLANITGCALGVIGALVDVYTIAGIVLTLLVYFKVIKK